MRPAPGCGRSAPALVIGGSGAAYAVFGGLKTVAVSDTLNGIGLLAIGTLVPVLGLIALGGGNLLDGLAKLTADHPEKLNAIGSASDPMPFGTIFTCMIFANLFYWCTNQYVIQRTLGARSLAEGQKGVLASGFFKVLVPFMMMIPGVIAFHLYGPGLASIDKAYPRLVEDVLPAWLSGVFLAVLLGAVFSSFNSLLNNAATLFTLDIWAPLKREMPSDGLLVSVAKRVSVLIAIASFAVAPLLHYAKEGLWQIVRIFVGFYNIPTVAVMIVGLFTRRVPAIGAKCAIVFNVIAYGLLRFVFDDVVTLHFIHLYAILFVIEVGIMLAAGTLRPRAKRYVPPQERPVDMTPWRHGRSTAFTLLSCVVALYVAFSPLGLAGAETTTPAATILAALLLANVAVWAKPGLLRRPRRA